jgi:Zn-dependent alcohol dehydrogenase
MYMSALDSVIAAVRASDKLDAGRKQMVVAFLQAAGPAVMGLGETGLAAVLGTAASGGDMMQAVAQNLDARGVAALLALTETQMAALADQHAAEAQAARAALQTLESAALMALAQAVVGAL